MNQHPRLARPFFLALIALLTVAVYVPGLSGGYIFDDFPNIVNNDRLAVDRLALTDWFRAVFSKDSLTGRPLAMFTFAVERYFFDLNPFVMKVTNLTIHVVNSWLVFALISRLTNRYRALYDRPFSVTPMTFALLAAMAWAVAPINLTGVLYVVQRMESLATLIVLVGLLAHLRGRERLAAGQPRALRWLWGGIIGGLLVGVPVKESAVMLPVYALVIEAIFYQFGKPGSAERRAIFKIYLMLLVLPAIAGMLVIAPRVFGPDAYARRDFTLAERLWTEGRVIWHYMAWTIFPTNDALSIYHDDFRVSTGPFTPWTTVPAAVSLAALTGGAWVLRRRAPWLSFGVLWFLVMHLLVSTVLSLELVHEHRNYLGSLGLVVAFLALVLDRRLSHYKIAQLVAVLGLVAWFTFVTTIRSHQWGDPLRHAAVEAAERPDSSRARSGFARRLMQRNDEPGSESFQRAVRILTELKENNPDSLSPWASLIVVHARHDELSVNPQWWAEMQRYLANNPLRASDEIALDTLVDARIDGGIPIPEAPVADLLEAATEKAPNNSKLVTLHAHFVLNGVGDMERGYELLKRATVAAPTKAQPWRNLIAHQLRLGLASKARNSLARLQEIDTFGIHNAFIERQRAKLNEARAE